jgi:hypothetical protein
MHRFGPAPTLSLTRSLTHTHTHHQTSHKLTSVMRCDVMCDALCAMRCVQVTTSANPLRLVVSRSYKEQTTFFDVLTPNKQNTASASDLEDFKIHVRMRGLEFMD